MKEFIVKVLKFLLVGCLNTLVDFCFFNLVLLLSPDTRGWTVAATVIGYSCGILCSYILNRKWTFRSSDGLVSMAFIRFVVVNLVSLLSKTAISYLLNGRLPDVLFVSGENVVWLIGTCVTLAINFLGSYFFAFAEKKDKTDLSGDDDTSVSETKR